MAMYGVTRAPFNSNRSSCGIEVVVPLFSHPKFETPSKVFRSNAQTTATAERGTEQEDRYLRRILVVGAIAVLRRAQENPGKYPWLTQLLARRPFKVVAVALANKMARMAWALLAHGGTYRAPELVETA